MKLFVVHPGWVTTSDWQEHHIGASRLMDLYGVTPDECIVWDDKRTTGYHPEYLDKLMHLYPRVDDYRPVSQREREMIRARLLPNGQS